MTVQVQYIRGCFARRLAIAGGHFDGAPEHAFVLGGGARQRHLHHGRPLVQSAHGQHRLRLPVKVPKVGAVGIDDSFTRATRIGLRRRIYLRRRRTHGRKAETQTGSAPSGREVQS